MVFRNQKGSSTLEAVILFPVILMLLFSFLGVLLYFFNQFAVYNSASHTLRTTAYAWYQDKSLYEDVLGDYSSSTAAKAKLGESRLMFQEKLRPIFKDKVSGSFYVNNALFYKTILVRSSFNQRHLFSLQESYPMYIGSVFLRNMEYSKALLEDAFGYLQDNLQSQERVYVVDDTLDAREYERIYHLYKDCSYLANGYKRSTTLGAERDLGFRVCRICLARKTGMD